LENGADASLCGEVASALLSPSVQPPGQQGKSEGRTGEHHHHKIRAQVRETPEVSAEFGTLFAGPPLSVPVLHQEGHEPFGFEDFS